MASAPFSHRRHSAAAQPQLIALACLALFALIVAALGGASRFDAAQAAALRPLVALMLIPTLYFISKDQLRGAVAPMVILAVFTAWCLVQLVPLPPAIWHNLPGRELLAELDQMHDLDDAWRPIAWVPMRAWNAVAGLIIPITAALLILAFRAQMTAALLIIVVLGVIDAALGLAQILGPPDGPLYLYAITNQGAAVGLFANENHSGVFSALVLLLIARLGLEKRPHFKRRDSAIALKVALAGAYVIVTLAVLVSSSRAAIGLALVSFAASGAMAWLMLQRHRTGSDKAGLLNLLGLYPKTALLISAIAVAALLGTLLQSGRAPGVLDAFSQDAFADLRWRLVPILTQMMQNYGLVGTGFGSFDAVYLIYEPTDFQSTAYLNQAHNDWAQLVIEGGAIAVILLLALLRWIAYAVSRIYSSDPASIARALFWCMAIGVIAVASLFDYPLRTPLFQMVAVWLVFALAYEADQYSRQASSDLAQE